MGLIEGTIQERIGRSKKMMVYIGIASLVMSFAGLTSAFIVSSKRPDWLTDFIMPQAFIASIVIIVLSSICLVVAKKAIIKNKQGLATGLILGSIVLGIAFIFSQIEGFKEIIAAGYNFTGPTSNITMSYVYIIAVVHILHVVAGLICLFVVFVNQLRNKYNAEQILGLELASIFWHFVDVLWIYLFLFLYFMK